MSDLKAEQHTVGDAERRVWHCESDTKRGLGFPRQDERARYVVHLLSHVRRFATLWTAAQQASLSFVISQNLLKHMFVDLVMPSNHLILCSPLLLLPSIFLSIRVFSNESLHQVAKVLELQLQLQSFQ